MDNWSSKSTPLWPTKEVIQKSSWKAKEAWSQGPALGDLIFEFLPIIRAYFLLGYRVEKIFFYNAFLASFEGTKVLNLETGELGVAAQGVGNPTASPPTNFWVSDLSSNKIHIAFGLKEIADVSGFLSPDSLYSTSDNSPVTPAANYPDISRIVEARTYACSTLGNANVITLAETVDKVADMRDATALLLNELFELIDLMWSDVSAEDEKFKLLRENGRGMLWIFDPEYWDNVTEKNDHSYQTPKNLLVGIGSSPTLFLLEQILDIKLRKKFFTNVTVQTEQQDSDEPDADDNEQDGGDLDADDDGGQPYGESPEANSATYSVTVAIERQLDFARYLRKRVRRTRRLNARPTLTHYKADLKILVAAPGVEYSEFKKIQSRKFVKSLIYNVRTRGLCHIWSYSRSRSIYASRRLSWLDMIITFAWEGAIDLPDAILPLAPPEPARLVATSPIEWKLIIHQDFCIKFLLKFDDKTDAKLEHKVAFDYKPGDSKKKPTLMIVASRGVEIIYQKYPKKGRDLVYKYNGRIEDMEKDKPWIFDIYRVQDDTLVPPLGANINPATFMSPTWFNPSPYKEVPDSGAQPTRRRDLVPLVFAPTIHSANDAVVECGVNIRPLKCGVRIEYPMAKDFVATGHTTNLDGEPPKILKIDNAAFWDITVDPLSGHAGYTYCLYLEKFASSPVTINLHVVVMISEEDTKIKTSLTSSNSVLADLGDAILGDNSSIEAAESPNDYDIRLIVHMDATAEFWKAKLVNLHNLPMPSSTNLPVSTELSTTVHDWINLYSSVTDRLQQNPPLAAHERIGLSPVEIERRTMAFSVPSDWTRKHIGGTDIEIKRLHNNEWSGSSPNDGVYMLLDLTLGFIPIIGDLADVTELTMALLTGRDRWGRPISNFDLSLMVIGSAVPFISSSGLRTAGTIANSRSVIDDLVDTQNEAANVDKFFRHAGSLLNKSDEWIEGETTPLFDLSETMMDIKRFDNRRANATLNRQHSDRFAQELIAKQYLIQKYLNRIGNATSAEFLVLDDIFVDGDFVYSVLKDDFAKAKRNLKVDRLSAKDYFGKYASSLSRVIGKALLGETAMRKYRLVAAKRGKCPSIDARPQRTGPDVLVKEISHSELIGAVKKYIDDVYDPNKTTLILEAGKGRYLLTDAKAILGKQGLDPDNFVGATDSHELILMLNQLTGNTTPSGMAKLEQLLVAGRKTNKELPLDEVGARVGESLIIALDQMVHRGGMTNVKLGNGVPNLESVFHDGGLPEDIRSFIVQWVNGAPSIYEHAVKAEMMSTLNLRISLEEITQNLGHALHGKILSISTQSLIPTIFSRRMAKGQDNTIVYVRGGVTMECRWQVKARSIENAMGYNVVNSEAVVGSPYFGKELYGLKPGAVPKVLVDVKITKTGHLNLNDDPIYDVVPQWTVYGGSSIFSQVISTRLRMAHFQGFAPPAGVKPPYDWTPSRSTTLSEATARGWIIAGDRHIYTIDDHNILNELISKLNAKISPANRGKLAIDDLKGFSKQEKNLLKSIYPNTNGAAIDLNDTKALRAAFDTNKSSIIAKLEEDLIGYEEKVEGLVDALTEIAPGRQVLKHTIKIRFASDPIENALNFLIN